jgi:hypothetical protein
MHKMTMRKVLPIFLVVAGLAVAGARSYTVSLTRPNMLGTTELKPGDYKIEVDGDKAILRQGKTQTESPVKVEEGDTKFDNNVVRYVNSADGKLHILPHPAGVGLGHRLAGLAGERLLELRHVLHHAVDAEFRRRVRVGLHLQAQRSSRSLEHHTWPKERKKRCSGVKPSIFFAVFPMVFSSAISATRTPPLSAVFSPSVSLPLTWRPAPP